MLVSVITDFFLLLISLLHSCFLRLLFLEMVYLHETFSSLPLMKVIRCIRCLCVCVCIKVHYFITELIMELHVDMTWNDELNDKSSAAFKDLSREFEKEVSVT